jgi:hypothetical protein
MELMNESELGLLWFSKIENAVFGHVVVCVLTDVLHAVSA